MKFTYYTPRGNPVTYHELPTTFTSLERIQITSNINTMIRMETLFSKPLNKFEYGELILEAKKLQAKSLLDLAKYRKSILLRNYQPDELFKEFKTIYRIEGNIGNNYFFPNKFARVPIPLRLQQEALNHHKSWLLVGITHDLKLKTYLVLEHFKENKL